MTGAPSLHTRDSLVARLRAIAAELGQRHVRRRDFERRTGIARFQVIQIGRAHV